MGFLVDEDGQRNLKCNSALVVEFESVIDNVSFVDGNKQGYR